MPFLYLHSNLVSSASLTGSDCAAATRPQDEAGAVVSSSVRSILLPCSQATSIRTTIASQLSSDTCTLHHTLTSHTPRAPFTHTWCGPPLHLAYPSLWNKLPFTGAHFLRRAHTLIAQHTFTCINTSHARSSPSPRTTHDKHLHLALTARQLHLTLNTYNFTAQAESSSYHFCLTMPPLRSGHLRVNLTPASTHLSAA